MEPNYHAKYAINTTANQKGVQTNNNVNKLDLPKEPLYQGGPELLQNADTLIMPLRYILRCTMNLFYHFQHGVFANTNSLR